MANRTFKVYGQAYAESGDVTATLTINGTQVFSGAVNDSTTVRSGAPTTENHLFSFELDENTTGNLSYSLAVTGGELCLGPTHYNGIHTKIIPDSWFAEHADELESAENQTYVATQIGQALLDAEKAGLYAKLTGGTATGADDGNAIHQANLKGPRSFGTTDADFVTADDNRTSAQINGENMEGWDDPNVNMGNWPILQDGETFTCTWSFSPDSYM